MPRAGQLPTQTIVPCFVQSPKLNHLAAVAIRNKANQKARGKLFPRSRLSTLHMQDLLLSGTVSQEGRIGYLRRTTFWSRTTHHIYSYVACQDIAESE
jgi:hypothetical protein